MTHLNIVAGNSWTDSQEKGNFDQQAQTLEEYESTNPIIINGHASRISVKLGLTISKGSGSYEFIRINSGATLPCTVETVNDVYSFLIAWVQAKIDQKTRILSPRSQLDPEDVVFPDWESYYSLDMSRGLICEGEIATVEVSLGETVNLGDFESLRFDIGATIPCLVHHVHEVESAWTTWAAEKLKDEMDEARQINSKS